MNDLIKLIEEMSMNAHPSLNTMIYDGWLIRLGEGYTARANSVNILTETSFALEEKITYCEQIYKKNNLSTIFKITPLSTSLDYLLEEKGYEKDSLTDLMVMDLGKLTWEGAQTVIQEGISETWERNFFQLNGVEQSQAVTAHKIFSLVLPPTYTATIFRDGEAVACGRSVIEHDYVSFYNIIVAQQYRRMGLGRDLCTSILSHALEQGAHKAYIQVLHDNVKAKNLYQQIGFHTLYQYWYRKKRGVKLI